MELFGSNMKVVFVTETYFPEVNGVAMTLKKIIDGLVERGHEVEVFRPRQSKEDTGRRNNPREIAMGGFPIPRYSELKFGWPAKRVFLKYFLNEHPDLVHVVTEGPLGFSAISAARKIGIPCVTDFHTNFHAYSKHYKFGLLHRLVLKYLRWFHNRALATFVPSKDIARQLKESGFHNVRVLGRGVDLSRFSPGKRNMALRSEWGVWEDEMVVIYVSRVAAEKNFELAIRAYREMEDILPGVKFVVVGDGPMRQELAEANPDIIFSGMRHDEDLASHFSSADLFIFPSLTETFGNVVTEAMASGLPVLAFDYAASGEYIESGVNGYKAEFGDEEDFYRKAILLAKNPENWTAMGMAAREAVESLGWDHIIDQIERDFRLFLNTCNSDTEDFPNVLESIPHEGNTVRPQ